MITDVKPRSEQVLFNCKVCSESFKLRKALDKHMQKTHPLLTVKEESEFNITNVATYECAECNARFIFKKSLRQHIQRRHMKLCSFENNESTEICPQFQFLNCNCPPETDYIDETERDFLHLECSVCLKEFSKKSALCKHIHRKHLRRKKENYKCNLCGDGFFYRKTLVRHLQEKHSEEICKNDTALICPCTFCDQKFHCQSDLKQHVAKNHLVENRHQTTVENLFKCNECNTFFTYRFHLMRHILKVHDSEQMKLRQLKQFHCELCDEKFMEKCTLNLHQRKQHRLYQYPSKRKGEDLFVCAHCCRWYSRRITLIVHIREKHPRMIIPMQRPKKRVQLFSEKSIKRIPAGRLCPLCPASYIRKSEIITHFRINHGKKIQMKTINLIDENAFNEWKQFFENETKSKFVKYNCYNSKNNTVKIFICHRSGCFHSKSRGVRRQRLHGTEKINGYCPAELKLTIWREDRKCEVHYIDEHVGHGQDLQFIKLPEPVEKLEESSSPKLDDNDSLTSDDKQLTDTIVLTSWISENLDCVLYFKGPEMVDKEFPDLKSGPEGDFVFAIMNDFQTDMFKQYAKDAVAVGQMVGPVGSGLHFFAVLVVDNYMQGIPCCFMLSNRTDRYVYEILFQKISEQTGKIQTKVFMSEPIHVYGDAWCNVMPPPEYRLWCSWIVLRYWDINLSKIKNMDLRRNVRRHLFMTRMELNPFSFHEMLQELLNNADPELREFLDFFNRYFVKNESFWAYCYRKHAGINTNYVTEHFFRTFKRLYLHKKMPYTLEEGLDALSTLLKVLRHEKLVREVRGKLVSKIKSLRLRHVQCMDEVEEKLGEIQCVSEDKWLVPSFGQRENGMISEMEDNCEEFVLPNVEMYEVERILKWCDCKLRCLDCKSCLHLYKCSCIDNCIKYNMCIHIHLVCTLLNRTEVHDNEDLVEVLEVNEMEGDDL